MLHLLLATPALEIPGALELPLYSNHLALSDLPCRQVAFLQAVVHPTPLLLPLVLEDLLLLLVSELLGRLAVVADCFVDLGGDLVRHPQEHFFLHKRMSTS